ncbi:MAG: hypothetical protein ABIK09_19700 [Pseudomonadota bacterium]
MLNYTDHARIRSQQRAVKQAAILAAMDWGDVYRQDLGRTAYYLGDRCVQRARTRGVRVDMFRWTLVVLGPDHALITVGRFASPRKARGRKTSVRRGSRSEVMR